jgi:hypothetical protein
MAGTSDRTAEETVHMPNLIKLREGESVSLSCVVLTSLVSHLLVTTSKTWINARSSLFSVQRILASQKFAGWHFKVRSAGSLLRGNTTQRSTASQQECACASDRFSPRRFIQIYKGTNITFFFFIFTRFVNVIYSIKVFSCTHHLYNICSVPPSRLLVKKMRY